MDFGALPNAMLHLSANSTVAVFRASAVSVLVHRAIRLFYQSDVPSDVDSNVYVFVRLAGRARVRLASKDMLLRSAVATLT